MSPARFKAPGRQGPHRAIPVTPLSLWCVGRGSRWLRVEWVCTACAHVEAGQCRSMWQTTRPPQVLPGDGGGCSVPRSPGSRSSWAVLCPGPEISFPFPTRRLRMCARFQQPAPVSVVGCLRPPEAPLPAAGGGGSAWKWLPPPTAYSNGEQPPTKACLWVVIETPALCTMCPEGGLTWHTPSLNLPCPVPLPHLASAAPGDTP